MRRCLARLLLLGVTLATALCPRSAGAADAPSSSHRHGVAVVFVVDDVSFEQLQFKDRGRLGGVGLMTTRAENGLYPASPYLTLGAGSVAPTKDNAFLLARDLKAHGVPVCGLGSPSSPTSLLAQDTLPGAGTCALGSDAPGTAGQWVPKVREFFTRDGLLIVDTSVYHPDDTSDRPFRPIGGVLARIESLLPSTRLLFLIVTPSPSTAMNHARDEVTPLVLGYGLVHRELGIRERPLHTLTSDTTRIDGLVSNVDVAPTILRFFGAPIPAEMDGQPIRVDGSIETAMALHQRHLEYRRTYVPVQLAEVSFISLAGLIAAGGLLWIRRGSSLPPRAAGTLRWLMVCSTALPAVLFIGGLLPHFTYAWVIPWIVLGTLLLCWLALRLEPEGFLAPLRFIAGAFLAFLVLDLVFFGGRALRFPLFGGTALDGARYYGLPNMAFSPMLASALFVAMGMDAWRGFVVLIGVGLLAGLPHLGADVGGAATLFVAAGLWLFLRVRRRPDLRGALAGLATLIAGTGGVLLANRFLPGAPTHATRFVERSTAGSAIGKLVDRLDLGFHQLARYPAAIIPLAGLLVLLVLLAVRARPLSEGLALLQGWREVLLILVLSCIVGYFANDTGSSAAGPGFLYAMAGITYPTVLAAGRRTAREPVTGQRHAAVRRVPT